jgi:hypothetical protein
MRWLGVTIGLLAASVSLVAWVYLRDRNTSQRGRGPERTVARADAAASLAVINGRGCRSDCAAELVERRQPGRWLARITVRGQTQCVEIDLDTFAIGSRHGLSGVQPSRCPDGAIGGARAGAGQKPVSH